MMELSGICREYVVGEEVVHALDHIDLKIDAGEYVSIMGPSGSGKSSLLNVLGLLDRPSSGIYRLQGEDVSNLDDNALAAHRQRHIGFIFQFFHLIPRLTALENVELPLVLTGAAPRARRERAAAILESVGLKARLSHRPDQLSGGERQRVAIGRAIVMQPSFLLADEPTGNLDTRSGNEIMQILEQLNRDGIAVLIVTHDAAIGDRARRHLKLRDGKIVADGSERKP
ncbi:MAG TPA: ABC transporter ATP-binding protein [Gammaproteobacteria bacterium]|nr:ABC transporter ATP-binding protein [Gammaproteobacteria bacterium]